MKKNYFLIIALFISFALGAQTTIDINAVNTAYKTTFNEDLVIDVAKTASKLAAPSLSYSNPFNGRTFTTAEISFDAYNYGDIHVLGSIFTIYDATLGRMYFSNGSYLGYNTGSTSYFDANLINYGVGTDFIGANTWKSIKLQFTATGYAMYVNNVLAFNQSSTNVTIAGPLTDFSNVINFLQNASTLMFGTGSWWSDNTDTNGAYFDFQSTYLKNIKFTPDFSSATAINQPTVDAKSELVGEEYLGISGVKVGKEYSKLLPGIYIKKSLYNDGSTKSEKIFKVQ